MQERAVPQAISDQAKWYAEESRGSRKKFFVLKSAQITIAASIPVIAIFGDWRGQKYTVAILGALVGIIESILQLGRYQENWISYRATREGLRREELFFSQGAGVYAEAGDKATQLFVERCDSIMSGENTRWLATQQQATSQK